jgi:hypothetical protein
MRAVGVCVAQVQGVADCLCKLTEAVRRICPEVGAELLRYESCRSVCGSAIYSGMRAES